MIDVRQFIRENSKPLNEVLTILAEQLRCDPQTLIAYAAEDTIGGYHANPALATFKQGSCWGVEGQILYTLVRHLKPEKVVEIGGWAGCSGAHLAAAVIRNGVGHVYSVDNEVGGQKHGVDMPQAYRDVVTLVSANGEDWLPTQEDGSIGVLFEDADHSTELVEKVSRLALRKIEAGGVLVNHDAMHKFAYVGGGQIIQSDVGDAVQEGLRRAGAYFSGYLAEPSDCGLAITVIPGVKVDKHSQKIVNQMLHDATIEHMTDPESGYVELIGNANIESVSTPPQPIEATNDPVVPKSQQVSKPRGKGKRKPSV